MARYKRIYPVARTDEFGQEFSYVTTPQGDLWVIDEWIDNEYYRQYAETTSRDKAIKILDDIYADAEARC